MKKRAIFVIMMVLLLGATVFAQESVDPNLEDFIKNIEKVKNIPEGKITDIKEVNLANLPQEVNLGNIDDTNLALYEISVDAENSVYVITASKELFEKTTVDYRQKLFLSFGRSLAASSDVFLETATGVESGYVMIRSGSITGLSTILDSVKRANDSPIEIIIMKNSEKIGFRNAFNLEKTGVYSDYDLISSDTINFEEGDIISVIINIPEGTEVEEISTLVEIEIE